MKVQSFKNPSTLGTNSVRYNLINGVHTVTHSMHCGEDIGPNVWRFDNVVDARNKWAVIVIIIKQLGYTEKLV